jgi:hypothetical protein
MTPGGIAVFKYLNSSHLQPLGAILGLTPFEHRCERQCPLMAAPCGLQPYPCYVYLRLLSHGVLKSATMPCKLDPLDCAPGPIPNLAKASQTPLWATECSSGLS